MRFLSVSLGWHPDVIGGAWRVAAAQASGLAARGHIVEAITGQPAEGTLPAVTDRDGVRIHRYPQQSGNFYTNWRAENRAAAALLRERLHHASAPVLILQQHAYLEPAVATATATAPVLHVFHGPWAEEYRFAVRARPRGAPRRALDLLIPHLLRHVEGRALRRARRVLVLSQHFAGELSRWHGRGLPPVEIAPGGVDPDLFHPAADRAALRAEWGLRPDDFLCVALRRLDPRMGLDLLIDAFGQLAGEFPRARLWLAGRGPAEAALRARIDGLGLREVVRLLGFLPEPDLPRLLNAADLALMPSLDLEGFGLATAEALACGTPVLGSRAGATPELLNPLSADLLFEPGSRDSLTARLRAALRNPASLPERTRCAAYARERFTWTAQVNACERAAAELLQGRQTA